MNDRTEIIEMLERAGIEYEDMGDLLITVDDGEVEFHFYDDGSLDRITERLYPRYDYSTAQ